MADWLTCLRVGSAVIPSHGSSKDWRVKMGRIRAFLQDDIPRVAELNWQFLQGHADPHPPRLEEYLRQVFFQNPWLDSSIGSLVYEEGQRVVGFLGIVPRPMSVNGKRIQAAFGSGLVVHPESRWTLAGLQLLAAFMDGKQDRCVWPAVGSPLAARLVCPLRNVALWKRG